MTGYAIHLARVRAVIACDTAVFIPDRPPRLVGFDTKLHPLAHLRAAIFGRGMSGIITDVTGQLSMAPQLDTIERVAEALPGFLRAATLRYCRATGIGDPAGYGLVELFLVGWSEVERRMRPWYWANADDFTPRTDFAVVGSTLSVPPLPDDEMPPRRGSLDAQLLAVMKAQRRFFETHPEAGGMIGGEVQIWTLTRIGLSQRVVHRFPDQKPDTDFLAGIESAPTNMAERLFTVAEMQAASHILSAAPGVRASAVEPGGMIGGAARAVTSPILMENYIRAWSGGLGMYALQIADASLRKSGLLPDPPRPEDDLADIPVVKAFVVRYPSASAQSIQDFYDAYDRGKMFFDTWQARAREGDIEAMGRIQEAGGTSMFLRLDSMHKTLGSQAQFVRDIWKNPTMPPEEKRQFIDDAYRGMLAVATTGANLLRDVQAMPAPEPPATPPPAPPDGAQWAAQKRQQLKAGGFSDQEIADYLARAPKALAAAP